MKIFYEVLETQEWNEEKQDYEMNNVAYFQSIYHAYEFCKERNEGTGNYIISIELANENLNNYGSTDVGYLTISEHKFND